MVEKNFTYIFTNPEMDEPKDSMGHDLVLWPVDVYKRQYVAIDAAISDVRHKDCGQVPDHLKDSHYSGASKLGHGKAYKYAHNYPNGYVKQQYFCLLYTSSEPYLSIASSHVIRGIGKEISLPNAVLNT